jgi:hypothetical protein
MTLPPDIVAKRAIEDRAAKLGSTRTTLEANLNTNTAEIRALLRDSADTGVSLDLLSQLTHVSRQSLHRWRDESLDEDASNEDAPVMSFGSLTLRQAIRLVVAEASVGSEALHPREIINALEGRSLLPTARSADQMVRNRLKSMLAANELNRDEQGRYWLDEPSPVLNRIAAVGQMNEVHSS